MRLAMLSLAICAAGAAAASDLNGPARFCGYSPVIDLVAGERVTTLEGGIHGGSFRWTGAFGTLTVHGLGWANRPKGKVVATAPAGMQRFRQVRRGGEFTVAIWNGRHGAGYFSAERPLTPAQLAAVDRVTLYDEGEPPQGCRLRTVFSWE